MRKYEWSERYDDNKIIINEVEAEHVTFEHGHVAFWRHGELYPGTVAVNRHPDRLIVAVRNDLMLSLKDVTDVND